MGIIRFNLPTLLTLSRILLIPLFLIFTPSHPVIGTLLFFVASLTDFLDGYIARKTGQSTKFGMILDPIADKFLVISALILLVDMALVSVFVAVVIIIREFLVTGLRVVALTKNMVMPSSRIGKLKTFTEMAAIVMLILRDSLFGIDLYPAGIVTIWVAMLLAVYSGGLYTLNFWRAVSQ